MEIDEATLQSLNASISACTSAARAINDGVTELLPVMGKLKANVEAALNPPRALTEAEKTENAAKAKSISELQAGIYKRMWFRFLTTLAASLLVFAVSVKFGDSSVDKVLLGELPVQLAFLAFVVALASYLAGVVRESVKLLGTTVGLDHERRREEISYVVTGEQLLVMLGLLTISRITLVPVGSTLPFLKDHPLGYTDHGLIIFLAAVIVYLAYVHYLQWAKHWKKRKAAQ
jgi:hypothetical protein